MLANLGTCDKLDERSELHYGRLVIHSEPVTGVYSQHDLESWAFDDAFDPDYGKFCPFCGSELRRAFQVRCSHCSESCQWDTIDYDPQTELLGDWRVEHKSGRSYVPRVKGQWAGIYNRDYSTVQIVYSKTIRFGRLASPCYPGQVSAELDDTDQPDSTHVQAYYAVPNDLLFRS